MKRFALISAGVLFLASCEFAQDPLAGAHNAVKNAQPPVEGKPAPPPPVPKEYLIIEAPQVTNTLINELVEIKISGRVLAADAPFQITVDNLSDFEGATFDEVQSVFSWTPKKSILSSNSYVEVPLRISIFTLPTEKNPVSFAETKTVSVVVFNVYSPPVIRSFSGPKSLEVGKTYEFEFSVDDLDAAKVDDLEIIPIDCTSAYRRSISTLMTLEEIAADPIVKGRYNGKMTLDLSSAQGLSRDTYCVGLRTASKYGAMSNVSILSVNVEPRLRHTSASFPGTVVVAAGRTHQFYFSIFDPLAMGEVTLVSTGDIGDELPGSSIFCETESWSRYQLNCTATLVTTPDTPLRAYRTRLVVKNTNTRTGKAIEDSHYLRIEVK